MAGSCRIYMDANATVTPLPQVVDAVRAAMETGPGNPSSIHLEGDRARGMLERARNHVRRLLPADVEDVIFVSGGTEANNMAIGLQDPVWQSRSSMLITTVVEHPSVLRPAEAIAERGVRVVLVPVGSDGRVDPDAFGRAAAQAGRVPVVSIQWANSETGVIQPLADVMRAVRDARPDAWIHVDAAQAIGRIGLDEWPAGISAITFSGHKIHGPLGTGVIALAEDGQRDMCPMHLGGGQERGYRSGTENVPGVVGLGCAAAIRADGLKAAMERLRTLRDAFEYLVRDGCPGVTINGGLAPRVPNTSSLSFPGLDGAVLLARLDADGLACSTGSACSSGSPSPSHVLRAMGMTADQAFSSVRFSVSVENRPEEIVEAARVVIRTVKDARS